LAYIGVQPADAYTSFAVQHFTTSATTSYTLDNPVANENEIALFINNVRQEPGSSYAYTASGTALTLSAATSASDTMYCVFIGKAVQTVTPASGSVTNDMISYPLAKSGATVSTFNRTTSDGDIVELQKDGTTVGSIGSSAGNYLTIGNNVNTRLRFTASDIRPCDSSGADRDNAIDLGDGVVGARFKDLYLGGNIYLGGTGSANALDDYEEGTFTPTVGGASSDPTVTFNARSGNYTKIGNRVFINLIVYTNSISGGGGNFNIRGLPFTSNARGTGSMIFDRMRIQASYQNEVTPYVEANSTYLAIGEMNDAIDEARAHIQIDDLASNVYIMLSAQYTTDS
jgi:hypothetical protein